MGVLAEITKRMLRASEGAFRVNHPFGAEQRTKPCREGLRILKRSECSVEAKFVHCASFQRPSMFVFCSPSAIQSACGEMVYRDGRGCRWKAAQPRRAG